MPFGPAYTDYNAYRKPLLMCAECCALVQPLDHAQAAHEQWHANHVPKELAVSNVKWCDRGDHAFKAGSPGSQTVTGTEYDSDGNPRRVEQDICPEHAFSAPQAAARKSLDGAKAAE